MFKTSFFWPNSPKKALLLLIIVLMVPLRHSELFGLMRSEMLVFGWLPVQMAFDLFYVLIGLSIVSYIVSTYQPNIPAKYRDREEER